ncbi:MAG: sulfoxide reductase heme-binding subunit YedZ [Caldilineae bacterium]|nr:MAG: sulfoxide reductase heme-binding subunit YedZ [Caldilineae bacterium]
MQFPSLRTQKRLTHLGALTPLAILVWDYLHNDLTFNPIQEVTLRTGRYALTLLILSLAVTPIASLTGRRKLLPLRRLLGLYAFFYAALHFLIFVGLDYGFDPALLREAIFEKRYALVGFMAFVILMSLAATSSRAMMKRLGKNWKRLHRLVYAAGLLVIIHFVWLVKSDVRRPLLYGAVLVAFLLLRWSPLRRWLTRRRRRPVRPARAPANAPLPK